ncbi:MAG TPA: hypothetical protein VGN26_18530 [Armatimonadota bacterium]|jgi:hypothetical protein
MRELDLISQAPGTPEYYVLLVVIGLVYYAAFARTLYGLFDPLVMLLINFVFPGTLVAWGTLNGFIQGQYLGAYIACSAALVAGYHLGVRRMHAGRAADTAAPEPGSPEGRLNLDHLFILVLALLVIGAVSLAYAASRGSIALFTDNPANDRVAVNAANRWLIVLWSGLSTPGLIVPCLVALHTRSQYRRWVSVLGALCWVLVFAASGSKSGVLILVFTFGLLAVYLRVIGSNKSRLVGRYILVFFLVGLAYAAYVTSGLGFENRSWVSLLGMRLFLSGESYLYFFVANQYEVLKFTYEPVTYILHTLTAGLGLKLIPFNIGTALYGGYSGDYSGIGPNPQYVVEGMIFFGLYFAPLYSVVIGYLTGLSRRFMLDKVDNGRLLVFIVVFSNAGYLPVDVTLWEFDVLASAVILIPLYLITLAVTRALFGGTAGAVGTQPSIA